MTLAALLTMTVPLVPLAPKPEFDVALVPPRKPALIPEGADPLLFGIVPELMDDPAAVETVTSALAAAAIAVAWLDALMPELPDEMTSPLDVVTAIFPVP